MSPRLMRRPRKIDSHKMTDKSQLDELITLYNKRARTKQV